MPLGNVTYTWVCPLLVAYRIIFILLSMPISLIFTTLFVRPVYLLCKVLLLEILGIRRLNVSNPILSLSLNITLTHLHSLRKRQHVKLKLTRQCWALEGLGIAALKSYICERLFTILLTHFWMIFTSGSVRLLVDLVCLLVNYSAVSTARDHSFIHLVSWFNIYIVSLQDMLAAETCPAAGLRLDVLLNPFPPFCLALTPLHSILPSL